MPANFDYSKPVMTCHEGVWICHGEDCGPSYSTLREAKLHIKYAHEIEDLTVDGNKIYTTREREFADERKKLIESDIHNRAVNPTQKGINTDPDYWLRYAESLMPAVPQQAKDYVLEYGVFVGESRERHFINKPAGGNVTLCDLPCTFVRGASIDAERTCEKCAERQLALRRK